MLRLYQTQCNIAAAMKNGIVKKLLNRSAVLDGMDLRMFYHCTTALRLTTMKRFGAMKNATTFDALHKPEPQCGSTKVAGRFFCKHNRRAVE